jgi:acylphosphatase
MERLPYRLMAAGAVKNYFGTDVSNVEPSHDGYGYSFDVTPSDSDGKVQFVVYRSDSRHDALKESITDSIENLADEFLQKNISVELPIEAIAAIKTINFRRHNHLKQFQRKLPSVGLPEEAIAPIRDSCSTNEILLKLIKNMDQFVEEAIDTYGVGHFLVVEDDYEKRETRYKDEYYYIYRARRRFFFL